ncbi:hypothetical protein [Chryseobacterium populi]|uniref:hypothetical protein n=1 Tax=Chryseobacterium populi TaxID=1144316 RepID=UPI0012E0B91A|nr:hypothetical protein [Chryseobacterium populi]
MTPIITGRNIQELKYHRPYSPLIRRQQHLGTGYAVHKIQHLITHLFAQEAGCIENIFHFFAGNMSRVPDSGL